ncbi:MAG: YjcQ family protein [Bacillota bacterium]
MKKGNCTFSTEDFWLEREELFDVLRLADLENYLINITYADNIPNFFDMMELTMKRLDFLKESSKLAKTYRGLKEVRDWLKM